ncbi:hypothetical protein B0T26DRAFT_690530 [Lasiosphaeria miniovina]|uniref:GRF-type domain-containing protein n=1 Tax=Lasiosphaeria miniovina TaxID=1954250 RepID=A0AA40BIU5_9PEZI|nr:uncharacterized protein B0T26DRAFT_690530 [Lasiosphaeria miniovina]KAK0735015.1 hypothetical protein B0T26DRAFT_690530 [Lasiosphaeria miniovina]
MFSTPRKRSKFQGRTPGSSSSYKFARRESGGIFQNGGWFCNCDPRLLASRFQTKKAGKNRGRWFFTCQRGPSEEQCDFFLWEDAAHERESESLFVGDGGSGLGAMSQNNGAIIYKSRDDTQAELVGTIGRDPPPLPVLTLRPIQSRQNLFTTGFSRILQSVDATGASDADQKAVATGWRPTTTLPVQASPIAANSASKRKRSLFGDEVGDIGIRRKDFEDFDSEDEQQLVERSDQSSRGQQRSQIATSTRQRQPYEFGEVSTPTPQRAPFTAPKSESTKLVRVSDVAAVRATPSSTPLSQRRGALEGSHGDLEQADDEDYQITAQVLDLLKDEPVTEATRGKLRGHLNNYALQMRGMERGRDMTRAAIKARDAKVGELQARVNELENECRTKREKIRSLSSGIRALVKGADDDDE